MASMASPVRPKLAVPCFHAVPVTPLRSCAHPAQMGLKVKQGVSLQWDGPVLWTKLIRVSFQGECTAVVAAWVAVCSALNSSGVRYPNEECGRMPL